MSRAGFTLIEVLVSAVLVAMVAVAIARGTAVVRSAIRAAAHTSLTAGQHLRVASHLAEARAAEVRAHGPTVAPTAPQVQVASSSYAPEPLTATRPGRQAPISACWVVAEHRGVSAARWVAGEPGGAP